MIFSENRFPLFGIMLYRLICGGDPVGDGLPLYHGFAAQYPPMPEIVAQHC